MSHSLTACFYHKGWPYIFRWRDMQAITVYGFFVWTIGPTIFYDRPLYQM